LKKNQLGKYIHKYIIAKQKTSSKNLKITRNEFCGVIYDSYIYVPTFLDERDKKDVRTVHCNKPREREREREREGNLTSPLCWPEKVVLVRVYLL
jgi:hypothetical protein